MVHPKRHEALANPVPPSRHSGVLADRRPGSRHRLPDPGLAQAGLRGRTAAAGMVSLAAVWSPLPPLPPGTQPRSIRPLAIQAAHSAELRMTVISDRALPAL